MKMTCRKINNRHLPHRHVQGYMKILLQKLYLINRHDSAPILNRTESAISCSWQQPHQRGGSYSTNEMTMNTQRPCRQHQHRRQQHNVRQFYNDENDDDENDQRGAVM